MRGQPEPVGCLARCSEKRQTEQEMCSAPATRRLICPILQLTAHSFDAMKPLIDCVRGILQLGAEYLERRSKAHLTRRLIHRLEELGLTVEVRLAA